MEQNEKEIGLKLAQALDECNITQRQFAKLAKKAEPTITGYVQGATRIPVVALWLAAKLTNRPLEWFLTSDTDIGSGVVKEPSSSYLVNDINVVTMPVRAMAGAGAPCCIDQLEPIGSITLDKSFDGPNIQVLQIRGSSMEPTIMDGAHVGIDITEREIISGQMYAVFMPHEGIVVKRIWIGPELVKISSDNPGAPDHDMLVERINWDTFVQGRLKWVVQKY